jgi:phospholipid/cholesterol/gamma-HCH transport system permease protein
MNSTTLTFSSRIKEFVFEIQEFALFAVSAIGSLRSAYHYRRDSVEQMYLIGVQALFIVMLAGMFMGVIMAIESGHRLETFGAKLLVGRTVALAMIRELGPVITGLMLAARNGSKNAAELGSMRVSEQIDALKAFGTDPVQKLVAPRLLASLVVFLPLTIIADSIGIMAGMGVSDLWLHVDPSFYWLSAVGGVQLKDLFVGFAKPFVFGTAISVISCFYGLRTTGGTAGVGRSTINSVVVSSVMVLFFDFIFTKVIWELL